MEFENRPRPGKAKLEEVLVRQGVITAEQLKQALAEQKKWGGELARVFVDLGMLTEEQLMKALGEVLGIGMCNPAVDPIAPEIVSALGVQVCERFGVIAVGGEPAKKVLKVATSDPTNHAELKSLALTTKFRIEPVAATSESITRAIRRYYYGEALARPGEQRSLTGAELSASSRRPAAPAAAAPDLPELRPPSPVASPSSGTPAPFSSPPSVAPSSLDLLAQLQGRIFQLEQQVRPIREQVAELVANPQFAALIARIERLEQIHASEVNAIRAIGEILIEKGLVLREDFVARMRKK